VAASQSFENAACASTLTCYHQASVSALSKAAAVSVRTDPLRARLVDLGYVPIGSAPAAFRARIEADIAKWSRIIESGNIKPN
jgi:tripartite-type tricarboxylate transporter receptor subunit TctC